MPTTSSTRWCGLALMFATLVMQACKAPKPGERTSSAQPAATMAPELREILMHGSALSMAGEQDSALTLYRRALSQWPNEYLVHAGLGTILDLTARFDEAREHWQRAIALALPSQRAGAHQQLAVSYAFQCRAEDAARAERVGIDARLSAQDFAGAAAIYNEQARIYLECGHPDEALRWYRDGYRTALRAPAPSDTARSLWEFRWEHAQARVAARLGQPDEARRHAEAAKAILDRGLNADQLPTLPYLSGYLALYAGDYSTAISELRRGNQSDPFVLALLAKAYNRNGDSTEAAVYRQRARAVNAHGITVAFARLMTKSP